MKFTNDCVHVCSTASGSGSGVTWAGQSYRKDGTMLADFTNSAVPFGAFSVRLGIKWRPDGRIMLSKAVPSPSTGFVDNGIAYRNTGQLHVVTLGAAGASVRYIEGLPFDDQGRLRINEITGIEP